MELVLGTASSTDTDLLLPCAEIQAFISAKDAVGLMSQSYFPDAIRILYQPVIEFIKSDSTIEQILIAIYYRKECVGAVLQILKDNLVAAFKDSKSGSIALAEFLLEQKSTLNRIFSILTGFTIFDTQHRAVFLETPITSTKSPFFKVVAAMLTSFSLYYEHLLAFVDYLLEEPIRFESLVALAGYPAFQELLETLFTVKLNRTNEVIERIATAWKTAGFGGTVFKYLFRFIEFQSTTPTCIDSTKALTELLINGMLMDLGFITESVLERIPVLTETILFMVPHAMASDADGCPLEESIYMRTNALRSLIDLWICAVRYLMVRLHQSVASIYFYQDNPQYSRGDIIPISDMISKGVYGIKVFIQLLDVLKKCDFVEFYTEDKHSSSLYFMLYKISAVARLLCVAGDIRSAYFSRTFGYFPVDYFASPETTRTIPVFQKNQSYGMIPPSATLTVAGSCDVTIEEICETDTGALIEGSMLGIVRVLLQSNIHLLSGRLLNNSRDISYLYSLGSTISMLLLEYRFYIPDLVEKVVRNIYMENLFHNTLEALGRMKGCDNVNPRQQKRRHSARTIYAYAFIRNIYRIYAAENDRVYCLKKRQQSMQNLDSSFGDPHKQRDGEPLAPLLTSNFITYKVKEAIDAENQKH